MSFHLHVLAQLQIQRAKRLVQQNDLRVANKRSRNGNALLLTAGKLLDRALFVALEVDDRQHVLDPAPDLILGQLFELQTKGDVVIYI